MLLVAVNAGADVFESSETSNIATKSIRRHVARWNHRDNRRRASSHASTSIQFTSLALKFDLEEQGGIGRDDAACPASAVAKAGRNEKLTLAADLHGGDALVPARDHLAGTDLERERLAVILRAVELRSLARRSHSHPV